MSHEIFSIEFQDLIVVIQSFLILIFFYHNSTHTEVRLDTPGLDNDNLF